MTSLHHRKSQMPVRTLLHHTATPQLALAAQEMDAGPCHGPPSFQLGLETLLYPCPLSTYAGENLASHSHWGTTSIPQVS